MIVATAAILGFGAGGWETSYGIATVGPVPSGLPQLALPPFNVDLWLDLIPSSAMIALVAYVESFSIGTTIATKQHTRLPSQHSWLPQQWENSPLSTATHTSV